jgi:hypothetical protein
MEFDSQYALSWQSANSFCTSRGGSLPSMHSVTEDAVVQTAVAAGTAQYWIGLQHNTDGTFAWSDGSQASYFNWDHAQPAVDNSSTWCAYATVTDVAVLSNRNSWTMTYCDDRQRLSSKIMCEFTIFTRTSLCTLSVLCDWWQVSHTDELLLCCFRIAMAIESQRPPQVQSARRKAVFTFTASAGCICFPTFSPSAPTTTGTLCRGVPSTTPLCQSSTR